MTTSRMLLRTVVPPVLALGLVALVVHPLQALASPTAAPATAPAAAVPPAMLADHASSARTPGSSVSSAIPVVAFQQRATLVGGRLRTAVLVNAADPAGTASLAGIPGCSAAAAPGAPAWIDCAYDGTAATVTVRVTLSDGRSFAQSGVPVVVG